MNKAFTLLLLSCLATLTLSFVQDAIPNDDKVKIDFYFESLCPYCQ